MTTKQEKLILKQRHSVVDHSHIDKNSSQFSNLNLNQGHKCSTGISHFQSFSKSNIDKRFGHTETKNYQEKIKSWDKPAQSSSCTHREAETEKHRNHGMNDKNEGSNKRSSSTLSLHIAAYEDFINAQVEDPFVEMKKTTTKSLKNVEQYSVGISFNDQLEFPRQQENGPTTPDVQQFAASQRLFKPNQGAPSTQLQPPPSEVENVSPVKQQAKADDSKDENMSDSNVGESKTTNKGTTSDEDSHGWKFPDKEKLKCTPAIQKLRKGLAEFDVRSPSDAMMSPVTAKLSQVRHTMKQSDAIRHGRGGDAGRKLPSPQRLIFEEDEE